MVIDMARDKRKLVSVKSIFLARIAYCYIEGNTKKMAYYDYLGTS